MGNEPSGSKGQGRTGARPRATLVYVPLLLIVLQAAVLVTAVLVTGLTELRTVLDNPLGCPKPLEIQASSLESMIKNETTRSINMIAALAESKKAEIAKETAKDIALIRAEAVASKTEISKLSISIIDQLRRLEAELGRISTNTSISSISTRTVPIVTNSITARGTAWNGAYVSASIAHIRLPAPRLYDIHAVFTPVFVGFMNETDHPVYINVSLYVNNEYVVSRELFYPSTLYNKYPPVVFDVNVTAPYVASVRVCCTVFVQPGSSPMTVCFSRGNPFPPSVHELNVDTRLVIEPQLEPTLMLSINSTQRIKGG